MYASGGSIVPQGVKGGRSSNKISAQTHGWVKIQPCLGAV